MKIKFIDIGNKKENWESDCPIKNLREPLYSFIRSQLREHFIYCKQNLNYTLHDKVGYIYDGYHYLGKFEVA